MIRLLCLFLGAVASLWSVTASPGDIKLYMRAGSGLGYSWFGTRAPKSTAITVSGTGAWNISRGGELSTACGLAYGYCFNISTSPTASSGAALPAGSGPATLYLYWSSLGAESLSPGIHTGTVTIGTTVINITLSVEPRRSFDAFVYPAGFPSGCVNSFSAFSHADTCTVTNERPTSTSFVIPAPGGTYVDPQFGNTVRRITPSGQNIQYSALGAFSASAKYVLTNSPTGQVNVYNRNGTAAYTAVSGPNINYSAWDPSDDERLWYMEAATIKYRQLNTGATVVAADYSSPAGSRPAMPSINMGGTTDITDDGWWVFRDGAGSTLCAVNLNGLAPSTQESKTFCAGLGSLGLTDIDYPQVTQVDSESRKRYVLVIAAPATHVFSVGQTGLDYEFPVPSGTEDLSVEPHSEVGQDAEGRQIFFWHWYTPFDNRYYLAASQLNKGADMTRPVEEGGGMRLLYLSDPANFNTDAHYGCNWRSACVFTPYGNALGIPVTQISAVTAGTPCAITTASAHGFTNGASVQIGGGLGTTGMNGVFSISVTGTNTFTLTGQTCSGAYTSGSAHVAANALTASASPNRQEIVVVRPGEDVRRVAIHRSKVYNGGALLAYFASPRTSISRDGRYVAYASNYGVPEQPSVWIADLGAPVTSTRIRVKNVDAADTKAILNYDAPAGEGAATIVVSADPGLSNPVLNAVDGLTGDSRQFVVNGLSAQTNYWYRITTGRYATQGRFRTGGALSGTATFRVERGGGGTVQYGPTAALGLSGASPVSVTVNRGVYYYNAGAGVQAVVVR